MARRTKYDKWTWPKFRRIAANYETRGDLAKGNRAAYEAGRRNDWLNRHYGEHTKRRFRHEHEVTL